MEATEVATEVMEAAMEVMEAAMEAMEDMEVLAAMEWEACTGWEDTV